MGTIIGIDFGTSTTEAAVIRGGRPEVILNLDKKDVTPSVVGMDDSGNILVGEPALSRQLTAPEQTVLEIKRRMGTSEKVYMGKAAFSPVEISAQILSYVRRYASDYLDEDISRAVISVPAYFDEIQRQATVEAGRQAGFFVERIINEPTAAALCYGISHLDEESHVLVYDMGGGTFDVTLLELYNGVLEVKASSGDNLLGGKDFDDQLVGLLTKRFLDKYGIDLGADIRAMARLRDEAVRCKLELSKNEQARVVLEDIAPKDGGMLTLDETVTREEFEELIRDLVARTHAPIDVVFKDSGILKENLDLILLVGGSTKIPLVQRDVRDYLGREPAHAVDPDLAVAEGTAIQAGIISGALDGEDGLIMTDVNPYTLGIRATSGWRDDHMSVLIPRNTTIPVTRRELYTTIWDGQEAAEVEVYQGESESVEDNHLLGRFRISGIPYNRAGEEQVEVAFSYNLNGMLNVSATVVSTGEAADIRIDLLEKKRGRADVSGWKRSGLADHFRERVRGCEKWLRENQGMVNGIRLEKMDEYLYRLKKAMVENDRSEAENCDAELRFMMED